VDRLVVQRVRMPPARRLIALVATLAACVLLGVGCSSSQSANTRPSVSLSPAPTAACSQYAPDPTRRVITAFLDAYNAGCVRVWEDRGLAHKQLVGARRLLSALALTG
jgi:hypothetical protein